MKIFGKDGTLLAEKFNVKEASGFITDDSSPIQISVMDWKIPRQVEFHKHNHIDKMTSSTVEVWYILTGEFSVVLEYQTKFEYKLTQGDMFITYNGYHSIKSNQPNSKFIEIRNGPYLGRNVEISEYVKG